MSGIRIKSCGGCAADRIVTNDDLAANIDTSDAWIFSRTGIRQRRCCEQETQLTLCEKAARDALERSGIAPNEIGVCIVATMSPENLMPATSCMLQSALGLEGDTLCFDLNAACSGFVYALHTMECLLAGAKKKLGLVVGGEALSRIVDWTDRGTCILFGDGAGAAIVEWKEEWPSIGTVTGCEGGSELLFAPGPGSGKKSLIAMDGQKVFKFAVETVSRTIDDVLARHDARLEDVDVFVFHQANERIIDLVAKRHRIPPQKVFKNIQHYGNTSAASIPLALSELSAQGGVHPGSRVLIVGFGGGLTWGGALVEFA